MCTKMKNGILILLNVCTYTRETIKVKKSTGVLDNFFLHK